MPAVHVRSGGYTGVFFKSRSLAFPHQKGRGKVQDASTDKGKDKDKGKGKDKRAGKDKELGGPRSEVQGPRSKVRSGSYMSFFFKSCSPAFPHAAKGIKGKVKEIKGKGDLQEQDVSTDKGKGEDKGKDKGVGKGKDKGVGKDACSEIWQAIRERAWREQVDADEGQN